MFCRRSPFSALSNTPWWTWHCSATQHTQQSKNTKNQIQSGHSKWLQTPKQFTGGTLNASAQVWEEFFSRTDSKSRQASKVLNWMRHGLKLKFVGTDHPSQEKAPHRRRNIQVVKQMLTRAVGADRVEEFLSGTEPARVQFPNHASVKKYGGICQ